MDKEWDIDAELRSLIIEKLRHDYSFKNVFRNDLTKQIFDNLHRRMFSEHKTDHFIAVIRGCEGINLTGVGKCVHQSVKTDYVLNEDGSWCHIPDLKEKTFCIDSNLNLKSTLVLNRFVRETPLLYKITTRTGRTITVTQTHPLLTVTGWIFAKKLRIGDSVAIARLINTVPSSFPRDCEIKLLAYMLADGNFENLTFTKKFDLDVLDDFKQSVNEFNLNLEVVNADTISYRIKRKIRNGKNEFRQFLVANGFTTQKSGEKFIPNLIMSSSKEGVALFLNRYFSCDGHCSESNIELTSKSELLNRQVQHLLLRFGIQSQLTSITRCATNTEKKIKHRYWRLVITNNESLHIFRTEIGMIERKINVLKIPENQNNNLDVIPKKIWNFISIKNWFILPKIFNKQYMGYALKDRSWSRPRLKILAESNENFLFKEYLQKLSSSDVYWDEIADIKAMKVSKHTKVYDVEVDESTHNFLANDFIVHNSSLGIELGMKYDKQFSLKKIDWTNEGLLKKIKEYGIVGQQSYEVAQVFMRDESPESLKRRSQVEFSIVQEALRDSRISLILIKPEPADLGLCHYIFEPLFFNMDFTKLKVCVVNPSTGHYRGFINVQIHKNNPVWVEYMKMKKSFEGDVVNRQVGSFIARDYAIKFMESVFYPNCYRMAKKDSHKIINVKRLKKYLNQFYSNLTNAERDFIIDDIKEVEEEKTKK